VFKWVEVITKQVVIEYFKTQTEISDRIPKKLLEDKDVVKTIMEAKLKRV